MPILLPVHELAEPVIQFVKAPSGLQGSFFVVGQVLFQRIPQPVGRNSGQGFGSGGYLSGYPFTKQFIEQIEVLFVLDESRFAQEIEVVDCHAAHLAHQRFEQGQVLR